MDIVHLFTNTRPSQLVLRSSVRELHTKLSLLYQAGGLSNMVFNEDILDLQCEDVVCVIHNNIRASNIALDQQAAFPLLSRGYTFWLLKRMRIKRAMRDLVSALYDSSRTCVYIENQLCGVKQGCPFSMLVFNLAFNLILTWISSKLSPYIAKAWP